jgi:hypothetical protein
MARKRAGDDRPTELLTVTVMDEQGRPRARFRMGDRISANVIANSYQREGSVVVIGPTRDSD